MAWRHFNTCIAEANGVYFARQDADDVSHLNPPEEQVAFLENHPNIDFLGTNVALCDAQGFWESGACQEFPKSRIFFFAHHLCTVP